MTGIIYIMYMLSCNGPVCGWNLYNNLVFTDPKACDKAIPEVEKLHSGMKFKCDWAKLQ
jgi:hypothetical protein